jgi:uncharacterized protein (TIGR02757 family)
MPSPLVKLLPCRRIESLRIRLEHFVNTTAVAPRLGFDPVEFPRRFHQADDVEVVGLISAALAYGRADLFNSRIQQMLTLMGDHPAAFSRAYALNPSPDFFRTVRYRFNEPPDFSALVAAIGWVSGKYGGLGQRFGTLLSGNDLRSALAAFGDELRTAPPVSSLLRRRGSRGLRYLLPDARLPGACKRWHLYLRWMVRGPDSVDLGVWRQVVRKSELVIPLDTHIARIAHHLGLTDRTDLTWRTAEEITANLRRIDPADPVRFDFALCHHGMSGACPPARTAANCTECGLNTECRARVRLGGQKQRAPRQPACRLKPGDIIAAGSGRPSTAA